MYNLKIQTCFKSANFEAILLSKTFFLDNYFLRKKLAKKLKNLKKNFIRTKFKKIKKIYPRILKNNAHITILYLTFLNGNPEA